MGQFDVSDESTHGNIRVIRVRGYVDFDVAPQLKQCISRRIEAGDRHVVVDLSDTEFIDSTAIGVLVGALKRLGDAGGSLALVCDNDDVCSIFEIVGLENVIPLHRSHDDAFAALAQVA